MDSSQVCKQEEIIAIGYSEEGEEEEEGRPPKVYRIGGRWLLTTGQSSGDTLADEHKFRPPN